MDGSRSRDVSAHGDRPFAPRSRRIHRRSASPGRSPRSPDPRQGFQGGTTVAARCVRHSLAGVGRRPLGAQRAARSSAARRRCRRHRRVVTAGTEYRRASSSDLRRGWQRNILARLSRCHPDACRAVRCPGCGRSAHRTGGAVEYRPGPARRCAGEARPCLMPCLERGCGQHHGDRCRSRRA